MFRKYAELYEEHWKPSSPKTSKAMAHYGPHDAPPQNDWKEYRKKGTSSHRQMDENFTATSRENEHSNGVPGDFLAPDGHRGFYIISKEFHDENYEAV